VAIRFSNSCGPFDQSSLQWSFDLTGRLRETHQVTLPTACSVETGKAKAEAMNPSTATSELAIKKLVNIDFAQRLGKQC